MEKGEIVFVRWYGDVLQGEVVENDRKDLLAGMAAVRIPIQGVRITALFHPDHVYNKWEEAANVSYPVSFPKPADIIHINPQHVYQSEGEAKGNSPIISSNSPKVATEASEISRTEPEEAKSYIADVYANTMIQRFKSSHWDEARNHLRIDALDEFYRLWLMTHDHRNQHASNDEITAQPQRDYGSSPVSRNAVKNCQGTAQRKAVQLELFS